MLTEAELKLVIETLSKRRAWLVKNTNSPTLGYNELEQHKVSVKLLDSAIEKIRIAAPQNVASQDTPTEAEKDYSNITVLIAEDDTYSAELLKEILGDLKISNIDIAKDGNQALAQIFKAEKPYDLVLCDWNMPGKTGLEVHSTMRTDKRFAQVIFMLVSANSESEQIRAAIQQGVNDYIVKPLDEDVLKRKITKAFERLSSRQPS